MIKISKNQSEFIRRKITNPYIVICSKRKKGSKRGTQSGKTYYCPESKEYITLLKKYDEMQKGDVDE